MIKKINIILSFLILISFAFLYNAKIVNAGTGSWAESILYESGEIYPGSSFRIWSNATGGGDFSSHLSLNTVISLPDRGYYNLNIYTVVQDKNLYTGAFVKASFYILSTANIVEKRFNYYNALDSVNDYVDVTKVESDVYFRGSSIQGDLYKISLSYRNQDCLDGGFGGDYVCYGDAYTRGIAALIRNVSGGHYIQLYGFGEVTYSDVIYSYPDQNIEDLPKLSAWETVKALPRNLLSWFTSLPTNIWNFMKDLPSLTWNFMKDLPSLTWEFIKVIPNNTFQFFKSSLDLIIDLLGPDTTDIDVSDLENASGWLPPGPVDSILTLPFTFLNNLKDNLNKNCQTVNLPLPYVNKNLPLPCVNSIYSSIPGLNVWISSISIIIAGIIGFKYLINLYKWVDDTLSFRENNHLDNWGGL